MGYQISSIGDSVVERRAVAAFLASFVRDGELLNPRPGDDQADVWEQRMGWWWDENPFCHDDSPRGYLLEHDESGIVGFNGLIPFEYEVDGELLPTLVTTTFFVRAGHRSAVMGLLSRLRGLAKTHQIIDGSPSPEMRRLLDRLGYHHAGDRTQFLFPTAKFGGAGSRAILRAIGWSHSLPPSEVVATCRIVRDPGVWGDFASPRDGRIHRRLTPDSLRWFIRIGSEKRDFFGLVDAAGEPLAHAIGIYKKRHGIQTCLLLDYREYREGEDGLGLLVRKLLDDPASGLDPATKMIVLSRFGEPPRSAIAGRKVDSILYYQIPPPWQHHKKSCLPVEGDLPLL